MRKMIFLLIVILLAGCGGKKQVKQPSEEYSYTTNSFKVVEAIKDAYLNKNNAEIRKYCSESAYREIIASIKPFDKAELEFSPVFGEIEGNDFKLYVSWSGKWSYVGKETEERGLAVFLMRGNPPRVERIIRGNPFKYPD